LPEDIVLLRISNSRDTIVSYKKHHWEFRLTEMNSSPELGEQLSSSQPFTYLHDEESSKPVESPVLIRITPVSTKTINRQSGKVDVERGARHTLNHRHQAPDETAPQPC
jgi:hypothetical protein